MVLCLELFIRKPNYFSLRSDKTITTESVKELARTHEITTGKWMLFVPWDKADEVWKRLVDGLLDIEFSDNLGVLYIQIVGKSDPATNPAASGIQRLLLTSVFLAAKTLPRSVFLYLDCLAYLLF